VKFSVKSWAAWSPGLETPSDWERWASNPCALAGEGNPDVGFIPPMLRRRCSPLTKVMLVSAMAACPEELQSKVPSVFASRHGAIHLAVKIIDTIYAGQTVSPMQFSHSVHNASAAQFSLATGNRSASSSIAAGTNTFVSGLVEAALFLHRYPDSPVLLVIGDEPVPPLFREIVDEVDAVYSLALLLEREGDASFACELGGEGKPLANKWPQAAEFLRWWLSGEKELCLGENERSARITRG